MGLFGVLRKLKTIIVIFVIILIVILIVRRFRLKNGLIDMIKNELNLADAVSKSRSVSGDSESDSLVSFLAKASKLVKVDVQPTSFSNSNIKRDNEEKENDGAVKKDIRNEPRRSGSKTSTYKREEICRSIFEEYFNDYFPTCRPKFLTNPETGRTLELDGYNASLNLAFEHQGMQHYVYPNRFHKTEEEFLKQQMRDAFKRDRCRELGIDLIEISYEIPTEEIRTWIIAELKNLGHKESSRS